MTAGIVGTAALTGTWTPSSNATRAGLLGFNALVFVRLRSAFSGRKRAQEFIFRRKILLKSNSLILYICFGAFGGQTSTERIIQPLNGWCRHFSPSSHQGPGNGLSNVGAHASPTATGMRIRTPWQPPSGWESTPRRPATSALARPRKISFSAKNVSKIYLLILKLYSAASGDRADNSYSYSSLERFPATAWQ